jgi:hypothetical protein
MFLHIIVSQNTKKSNAKETTFLNFIWCDLIIYLCKSNVHHNVLKNEKIFFNIKNIYVFIIFIIYTRHYDSIWLE